MKRSKFNLSHEHSTTMEMGKLVPMVMIDCLPGDIHRLSCQTIFRAQPMIAPLAHLIHYDMQYYFVPYRLLWENFTEFITGGVDGSAAFDFPVIKAPAEGWNINTMPDYMGFPIKQPEIEVSALPFRAITKIWNDHYKVEDIEKDLPLSVEDGLDTTTGVDLLPVHWKRDRFTRAKPFTQRGPQVNVPIYPSSSEGTYKKYEIYKPNYSNIEVLTEEPTDATLFGDASYQLLYSSDAVSRGYANLTNFNITTALGGIPTKGYIRVSVSPSELSVSKVDAGFPPLVTANFFIKFTVTLGQIQGYSDDPPINPPIEGRLEYFGAIRRKDAYSPTRFRATLPQDWTADNFSFEILSTNDLYIASNASSGGSLNIRDLRTASALQRYQEKSLKYGSEYEDYCRMEFGVRPRDSRLQKSEYIGGGRSVLQISEIFQTTPTENSPLGNMAGAGIGSYRQRRIKYHCPEHGIIIGFASIRPTTLYTQGIDRAWLKRSRFEYFTREFQAIGAQEILEQEIYATKDNAHKIFGYDLNGNYQEYRSMQNRVSGNFRTDLSFWNLSRIFESAPILNPGFLIMNPRKDIFAIQDGTLPPFLVMQRNLIISYRPMPKKVKARIQ